jgi:hypothetical protein
MIFDIPKGEYHRLIRGVNNLKCRIIKKWAIKKKEYIQYNHLELIV